MEKKIEIEVRELAEQFFDEEVKIIDDEERKEEVELEKETYIGVWMRGYRAAEATKLHEAEEKIKELGRKSAGESDAVAFAEWLYENRWFNKEGDLWCYTFEWGTRVSDATYRKNHMKTTAELYTIFKQQKEK